MNENPIFEDIYLTAFLHLFHRTTPNPYVENRRVYFRFPDTDTSAGVSAWFNNPSVPVMDYSRALRNIKTIISTAKTRQREEVTVIKKPFNFNK